MDGDLTRRLDVPGSDELSALNRAYNQAIENIQHIVQEIKSGALILSNASSDITDGNQDLAQRTDEQAASIVETAASMEQISTAISQTAHNASEAERLTQSMANDVMDATRVSNEASQSMAAIRSSSDNIFQIVASIDEISFQTNLLALNAAVEAARAGNWARVSPLWRQRCVISQRCAREASLIRELVNQNMNNIGEGVQRVSASEAALKAAADTTGRMKQYVSDIARAANEQSLGVTQVHQALNQLEQVTQQNAALVSRWQLPVKCLTHSRNRCPRLLTALYPEITESRHQVYPGVCRPLRTQQRLIILIRKRDITSRLYSTSSHRSLPE
jgi:methyl-accepting chemotaxis protein